MLMWTFLEALEKTFPSLGGSECLSRHNANGLGLIFAHFADSNGDAFPVGRR